MKDLIVDPKILKRQNGYPDFSVTYYLYEEDEKEPKGKVRITENPKKEKNVLEYANCACFASVHYGLQNCKHLNRLAYKPTPIPKFLTNDDILKRWVELAVKWKYLPAYVKPEHVEKTFVLKLEGLSLSLLYIYLCTLRNLYEFPDWVRIAVYLVDDRKVNFHAAMVIASKFACGNSNHNYISLSSSSYDNDTKRLPIKWITGLQRYLADPKKYDNRKDIHTGGGFLGQESIRQACSSSMHVKFEKIRNQHVIKAINSQDDDEIKTELAKV